MHLISQVFTYPTTSTSDLKVAQVVNYTSKNELITFEVLKANAQEADQGEIDNKDDQAMFDMLQQSQETGD